MSNELRKALETIANWELPETGRFWDNGKPMSFETCYGSNGVRDYFRNLAREALFAHPGEPEGWIGVEDNKPERRIRVFVSLDDGMLTKIGWIDNDDKWYFEAWDLEKDYSGLSKPTHWMPLPAPPIQITEL